MTSEEKTDLIRFLVDRWKSTHKEMLVYKRAFQLIVSENPGIRGSADRLLVTTRTQESLQRETDLFFADTQRILDHLGEGTLEKRARLLHEQSGPASQEN
jgi:hypothetical protein